MHDGPGVNISRTGGFSSPTISESLISIPSATAPLPRGVFAKRNPRSQFGRLADSIVSPNSARPVNDQNGHRPQMRAAGLKV